MAHPLLRAWLALAITFALYATQTQAARADANDDQARSLFEAGIAASRQTRWSEAEELFQRSRALVEKPSTLLNLAITQVNLGRGREALATLDRLDVIATPAAHETLLERARTLRVEARAAALSAAHNELFLDIPLSEEAKELLSSGTIAYGEGRYGEALSAFERSEATSGRPELLYNVGLAADRLQAEARALLAFEAFVAALPDHPKARGVGPRIETLRRIVRGEVRPAPDLSPTTVVTAPEPVRDPGPAAAGEPAPQQRPWLARRLLFAGGATAIGAISTSIWWLTRTDAQQRCNEKRDRCTNPDDITRQRRAALWTSVVLDVASVGLLATGATLLWKRKKKPESPRAWLRVHPAGLTVGVEHL